MSRGFIIMLVVIFILFVMQSLGGVIQIRDYQGTVRRVHKYGNLGIGQKRGNFFNAYLVMIACDNSGIITHAEILDGISILAKFHEFDTYLDRPIVGTSIYEYIYEFNFMDKKQRKRNKGYIDAIQALSDLLNPAEEAEAIEEEKQPELPSQEPVLLTVDEVAEAAEPENILNDKETVADEKGQ